MSEAIGIMDEGYFVPRGEILKWLNQILKLDLTMIEQLGSGAVYCQLLDAVCPGLVPLQKINWKAKGEYEFIQNLKVLQYVFDRVGMTKKLDIMKLAKTKYQDNLEFIQWMKRFIETQGGCKPDYDAVARRGNVHIDLTFADKKPNKENFKKMPSSASLQRMPLDFRKSCIDILAENNISKTPKKTSMQSNSALKKKIESGNSSSRRDTTRTAELQIDEIKQILQSKEGTDAQIEKIRVLLEVQRIDEEEDQDII